MNCPEIPVALSDLLRALAREIDGPRKAILAAEHHLAAVLRSSPATDSAAQDLQSIDLALQILSDLESFIMRLGQGLPAEFQVDAGPALQGLKLERVSLNIRAALGCPTTTHAMQPSIELF